jgi:ribosome-associated heat shock protein Hsp15
VSVADETIKASREVKVGSVITFRKGTIDFKIRVDDLPKSRVGAKLVPDYTTDLTAPEEYEKLEMIRLANRELGGRRLGRPTKKDRRDLNKFWMDESE